MTVTLWDPVELGGIRLASRLVMAPMTRDRSTPEGVPAEVNALYYAQRASVRPAGVMFTAGGPMEMPAPRALSIDDISATIDDHRRAAAAAIAAGADGVEIHGANGYLIHGEPADDTRLLALPATTSTDLTD